MSDGSVGIPIAGPCIEIHLGNQQIGFGYDWSLNIECQTQRIDEFGNFWTTQIEWTGGTVQVTMGKTLMTNVTLADLGILPVGDTATIMQTPALTLKLIDKRTKATMLRVEGIRLSSANIRAGARTLMTEDISLPGCQPFFGAQA